MEVPPEGSRVDPVVAAGIYSYFAVLWGTNNQCKTTQGQATMPQNVELAIHRQSATISVVLTPSLAPAEREAVRKSRHDGRARLLPLPNLIELFRRLPRRGEGVSPEARDTRAGDAAALVADLDRNVFLPLREDDRYRGHLVPVVLVPVRARL